VLEKRRVATVNPRTFKGGVWLKILLTLGASVIALVACATAGGGGQRRLERAQTNVIEASYDEVFPAVVEVLSRDYTLTIVDPGTGIIETAPKQDVVLDTGSFHGVYNLKVQAAVLQHEADRTKVRLRVQAGRLLDFVENRWEYKDFGSPQYYRDYFQVILKAVNERKGSH
jgi:hypothetical protein